MNAIHNIPLSDFSEQIPSSSSVVTVKLCGLLNQGKKCHCQLRLIDLQLEDLKCCPIKDVKVLVYIMERGGFFMIHWKGSENV